MERGIREGDLRDDLDPGFMVELMLGFDTRVMYSAVYVRLLFRYSELDRSFAEQLVATAMAGIRAGASVSQQLPRPVAVITGAYS